MTLIHRTKVSSHFMFYQCRAILTGMSWLSISHLNLHKIYDSTLKYLSEPTYDRVKCLSEYNDRAMYDFRLNYRHNILAKEKVAVLYDNTLFTEIPSNINNTIIIQSNNLNRVYTVIYTYFSPNITPSQFKNSLELIYPTSTPNTIILGDFNAECNEWSGRQLDYDRKGTILRNWAAFKRLNLLNDINEDTWTFAAMNNETKTWLDMAFYTNDLKDRISNFKLDDNIRSDHRRLSFKLYTGTFKTTLTSTFRTLDEGGVMLDSINMEIPNVDLNSKLEFITQAITASYNNNIKTITIKRKTLLAIKKIKRSIRNCRKRNMDYTGKKKDLKSLREKMKECSDNFIKENLYTPWIYWKKYRPDLLKQKRINLIINHQSLNEFLKTFNDQKPAETAPSHHNPGIIVNLNWKDIREKTTKKKCIYTDALNSDMLKFFILNLDFKTFIQDCIDRAFIPSRAKITKITPIPKKDTTKIRPISINHPIYRILDYIIYDQLKIQCRNLTFQNQYAFIPNKGINVFFGDIIYQITQILKEDVIIISVDITGAFDNISHKAIMTGLKRIGTHPHLISCIKGLVKDRYEWLPDFNVYRKVIKGVPQGAFISPLLFCITLQPLMDKWNNLYSFADDICIVIKGKNVENLIYNTLNLLDDDLNELGLSINPAKTKYALYKHRKSKLYNSINYKTNIIIRDVTILNTNWGPSLKFATLLNSIKNNTLLLSKLYTLNSKNLLYSPMTHINWWLNSILIPKFWYTATPSLFMCETIGDFNSIDSHLVKLIKRTFGYSNTVPTYSLLRIHNIKNSKCKFLNLAMEILRKRTDPNLRNWLINKINKLCIIKKNFYFQNLPQDFTHVTDCKHDIEIHGHSRFENNLTITTVTSIKDNTSIYTDRVVYTGQNWENTIIPYISMFEQLHKDGILDKIDSIGIFAPSGPVKHRLFNNKKFEKIDILILYNHKLHFHQINRKWQSYLKNISHKKVLSCPNLIPLTEDHLKYEFDTEYTTSNIACTILRSYNSTNLFGKLAPFYKFRTLLHLNSYIRTKNSPNINDLIPRLYVNNSLNIKLAAQWSTIKRIKNLHNNNNTTPNESTTTGCATNADD